MQLYISSFAIQHFCCVYTGSIFIHFSFFLLFVQGAYRCRRQILTQRPGAARKKKAEANGGIFPTGGPAEHSDRRPFQQQYLSERDITWRINFCCLLCYFSRRFYRLSADSGTRISTNISTLPSA